MMFAVNKLPFAFSRETERQAVDRVVREPKQREALYAMVDAIIEVRDSGTVNADTLNPILQGFQWRSEAVWSRAASWLRKLYMFAPTISPAIAGLAASRSATVRFNLCASLAEFPRERSIPLLRSFMEDKSARIRGTAANVILHAGYCELIPQLEARAEAEKDHDVREAYHSAIAHLKGEAVNEHGMIARRLPNGDLEFEVM